MILQEIILHSVSIKPGLGLWIALMRSVYETVKIHLAFLQMHALTRRGLCQSVNGSAQTPKKHQKKMKNKVKQLPLTKH